MKNMLVALLLAMAAAQPVLATGIVESARSGSGFGEDSFCGGLNSIGILILLPVCILDGQMTDADFAAAQKDVEEMASSVEKEEIQAQQTHLSMDLMQNPGKKKILIEILNGDRGYGEMSGHFPYLNFK